MNCLSKYTEYRLKHGKDPGQKIEEGLLMQTIGEADVSGLTDKDKARMHAEIEHVADLVTNNVRIFEECRKKYSGEL